MKICTLLSLHLCYVPAQTQKVSIRLNADASFKKIGYGQYEEGKLTTRTIKDGTFEDPNGNDVEIYILKYESKDKTKRTRDYVVSKYQEMINDESSWIYNINEKVIAFPIPLPDGAEYTTGKDSKSKNSALMMARNDLATPSLTKIKLTVLPMGPYAEMPRLQVKLESDPDQLQSSIRKLLETFVGKSNTDVQDWRVVNISKQDDSIYIVEFTYEKTIDNCDITNFAAIWEELIPGSDLSDSASDFQKLQKRLSKALTIQKVKVIGIKTIAGDDCNTGPIPPPVAPPSRPISSPNKPLKTELLKAFRPGKLVVIPLDEFGVNVDHIGTVQGIKSNHFFKIENNELKILLPPGNFKSALRETGGSSTLELNLVDENDNEVKLKLQRDDNPDDFFNFGSSDDEPRNTLTFDFNTQKENTWNIETSQQALDVLKKVQEAKITWYKLEGTKMIFELPEELAKCSKLKGLDWITDDGTIDSYELAGLAGKDGFRIANCDNCVLCESELTTAPSATSTTTPTTTTSTTTTTTTSTTTKKKVIKKCENVFFQNGKSTEEVTLQMDVDVNVKLSVDVNKLLEKAVSKKLLDRGKAKSNFNIKNVAPSMTGVSNYNAGEKKLSIFATDYSISNVAELTGSGGVKGAAHVITVEYESPIRKDCNRKLIMTLEIIPKIPARRCDFSVRKSHSHEFEIILKNFPSKYSIDDTYDVMKIIQDTYADEDMSHIYLLGFESTDLEEEQKDKTKKIYPAQKIVWGNSTLFNCEDQVNPPVAAVCPRDEIFTMTNQLVSKDVDGKTTWKVQKGFVDKFEDYPYTLNTVSARGIHSCSATPPASEKEPAAAPGQAGVNSKVIALIAITIGALLLIAACFYMKKRKENGTSGKPPRMKQGVPIMLGEELNDNRDEHDSLIATQNGNTAPYNEKDTLPAPPLQPEESQPLYEQPPADVPKVTVTPVAQITSEP